LCILSSIIVLQTGYPLKIELKQNENESGDQALANQGFGRITAQSPPMFDSSQQSAAVTFFNDNGFAVLGDCLDMQELTHLNEFFDRTQAECPQKWGLTERRKPHHREQGLIFSQPLLDYEELDKYTQHPRSFHIVDELMGGKARFSEFNFRETPANAGIGAMNFHHDNVSRDRLLRSPYMPCDWLCAIHYLTDVEEGTPSFCVVPKSNAYETLKEAHEALGEDYQEIPLYGKAGTCVLYDSATFHTRYDGDGKQSRRTWHQYYARGGWLRSALPTTNKYVRAPSPTLTDWNLFPERLAMHPDPEKRLFFSHWNTAQCEWVASGFDPAVRSAMPRGNQ
jgi:ectoine hydroxylase-related dioxygenase (phytanoyl-CoA dioxygenase family)